MNSIIFDIDNLFTVFLVSFFHYKYVSFLFENDRNFSHLSDLEREMSLRTEMGFYYSYYKTIVEEKPFVAGISKLIYDRIVEYPKEVNAFNRFNIHPEVWIVICINIAKGKFAVCKCNLLVYWFEISFFLNITVSMYSLTDRQSISTVWLTYKRGAIQLYQPTHLGLYKVNSQLQVLVGALYRYLEPWLNTTSYRECFLVNRGEGYEPVQSCVGLGHPIFFYLEAVWVFAGINVAALFLHALELRYPGCNLFI